MSEETEKKENILDLCRDTATKIGKSEWGDGTNKEYLPKGFGLCSYCKNFEYAETEFNIVWAKCDWFRDKCFLTQAAPIKVCTKFDKLGEPSLKEMVDMAILIECDRKIKVGFI